MLPAPGAKAVPVYPRVCGGTRWLSSPAYHGQGLSPRVRGNPTIAEEMLKMTRSIPACAGEPGGVRRACGDARVYPRVCGGTR